MRRELLRLIENEESARDGASANECKRLDLHEAAFQQALVRLDQRGVTVAAIVTRMAGLRGCHRREQLLVAILMPLLRNLLGRELRLLRGLRRNEHLKRVVVRLQP